MLLALLSTEDGKEGRDILDARNQAGASSDLCNAAASSLDDATFEFE
jgi:hypothetical protein